MKKYGEVVVMALGDKSANALVVQSVPQQDGEHLVVFYLDPAHEATAMGGQSVDAAIKKDFVTPLTEGKQFGWKELPEPVLPTGGEPSEDQASDEPSPSLKAAAAIIEQQSTLIKAHRQKIADLEAELEGVKTELATTTEGIDKQLQGIADATAANEAKIVFETKHYSDGSSATGVAPLPDLSPDQQDAAKEAAPEATENPTSISPAGEGSLDTAKQVDLETSSEPEHQQ